MCVNNINCFTNLDAKLSSRSVGVIEHSIINQDLETTDFLKQFCKTLVR